MRLDGHEMEGWMGQCGEEEEEEEGKHFFVSDKKVTGSQSGHANSERQVITWKRAHL